MKIQGKPTFTTYGKPNQFIITTGFKVIRGNDTLLIEPGLVFNGASIPFPFSIFIDSFDPRYTIPSIIHDGLVGEFGNKLEVTRDGVTRELIWKESAVWFREAMKVCGGDKLLRRVFYQSVMIPMRLRLRK